MRFSPEGQRPHIALFLAAACVVLSLVYLPPWIPAMPSNGLDPSWPAVLSHAFKRGWQFGTEIVYTFGPYGFLYRNLFDPANYAWMMTLWLVLALGFAATVFTLIRSLSVVDAVLVLALAFVGLRSGILTREYGGHYFHDAFFFVIPLLLAIAYCHADRRSARWLVPSLIALTALVGLVKLSFGVLGLAVVVILELHRFTQRRFNLAYLLLFLGCSLLFWVLAGQRLETIGPYLKHSLQIAGGYGEAMQYWDSPWELLWFAAISGAGLAIAWHAERRYGMSPQDEGRRYVFLTALAAYVVLAFKAGFVRQDIHVLIAWSSIAVAFAVYGSRFLALRTSVALRASMLLVMVAAAISAIVANGQQSRMALAGLLWDNLGGGLLRRITAIRGITFGDGVADLEGSRKDALARIRRESPLPPIDGSVDIYPWNAATVLAHGLDYRPRPVFQSFALYTVALVELNRAHIRSGRGAQTIFFDVSAIDNHFAPLEEGALWPDLIAHYDPVGLRNGMLMLRRRADPRLVQRSTLQTVRTTWSAPVPVPDVSGVVFASIDIKKTLLGRIANVLFKAPPITFLVEHADGSHRWSLLVPEMAREGFVLSPIVDSASKFDTLVTSGPGAFPIVARPAAMQLRRHAAIYGIPMLWFYEPEIVVSFESLAFSPSGDQPFAGPKNVAAAAAGAVATASTVHGASFPVAAVNDGDRTSANWTAGGGWNDATEGLFPDWVEIAFPRPETIGGITLHTLPDAYGSPEEAPDELLFTKFGVTDFAVLAWNGSEWVTLATVRGNRLVKRTVTFSPVTTDRIRLVIDAAAGGYSRIVEVEAWSVPPRN